MELRPYLRKVHYYETDQMAVVHHSNYIRWFEEARLDYLEQIGIPYDALEQRGIIIPVVDISCKYLVSARYGDTVEIRPILTQFTGVRVAYRYEIRIQKTGELCATGTSTHCFVDESHRPISLKRRDPALYQLLSGLVEPNK